MAKPQDSYPECRSQILGEIKRALESIDEPQVERLVDAILGAEKVFVIGVGRVMLALQAWAKRLNHLGVSAHCVGDINEPAIGKRDLLIVGSGSGESVVPVGIAEVAKRHGAALAHIGSNPDSTTASGVSSMVTSTPVAISNARILRPSRPIIRPFISSDGSRTTAWVDSTV